VSRAVTIAGTYRWRFDRKSRAWKAAGHPNLRIRPMMVERRRGRVSLGWVLTPGRILFHSYHEAMLEAESPHTRTR
jgi:hypothetical protein